MSSKDSAAPIQLSNGGTVEVSDYGHEVYIEVTFPDGSDGITISQAELTGRELQLVLRERYS